MTRTQGLLDELVSHLGQVSDGAVARSLGVTRATVSKWRVGVGTMSDEVAIRAAKILKRPIGEILATVAADRATEEQVKIEWTKVAKQMRSTAAVITLATLGITGFQTAKAQGAALNVRIESILC